MCQPAPVPVFVGHGELLVGGVGVDHGLVQAGVDGGVQVSEAGAGKAEHADRRHRDRSGSAASARRWCAPAPSPCRSCLSVSPVTVQVVCAGGGAGEAAGRQRDGVPGQRAGGEFAGAEVHGAVQAIVAVVSPGVAVTPVGGPGMMLKTITGVLLPVVVVLPSWPLALPPQQ